MGWGIAAAAAGNLVGGILGGIGGKRAGDTLAGGYAEASDIARAQYDKDRPLYDPYINAGKSSLADIAGLQNRGFFTDQFNARDLYSDPSYAFRLNQGTQAARSAANAGGGYGGGNSLAALTKYGQGLASTEYQNAYSRFQDTRNQTLERLLGIANQGQYGVTGATALGSELSGRLGDYAIGKAGARGAGINALYSGIGQGISSAGSLFGGLKK